MRTKKQKLTLKEKKAQRYGIRPVLDLPMLGYVTHQYYFSNQKIKDLGFKFKYNNFIKGTHETFEWYKKQGWFPTKSLETPEYINTIPKPVLAQKIEYKTPMEGGKIF